MRIFLKIFIFFHFIMINFSYAETIIDCTENDITIAYDNIQAAQQACYAVMETGGACNGGSVYIDGILVFRYVYFPPGSTEYQYFYANGTSYAFSCSPSQIPADEDEDGIPNECDFDFSNYSNEDCDGDGDINSIDLDDDGDGIADIVTPGHPDYDSTHPGSDFDFDGIINSLDTDIDEDGLLNDYDDNDYSNLGTGSQSQMINPDSTNSGASDMPDPNTLNPSDVLTGDDMSDFIDEDELFDLCESNPGCDCIPSSYTYAGAVDYNGNCCQAYTNGTSTFYCNCQSGSCSDFLTNNSDKYVTDSITAAIKDQGKNLTETQIKNALIEHYNKLSSDQQDRAEWLNVQQNTRNENLKQQITDAVEFQNSEQQQRDQTAQTNAEARHTDLKESIAENIQALDKNQESRNVSLKTAVNNLKDAVDGQGDDIQQAVENALTDSGVVDGSATYSDTTEGGDVDFQTPLASQSTRFSNLFNSFTSDLQSTTLFSLPFGLFNSFPEGSGNAIQNVSIGDWGPGAVNDVSFDWSQYSSVFNVLNSVLLILTSYACVKIILVKHA